MTIAKGTATGTDTARKASFFDEFFKVYLPDRSSQRLLVPPAFVRNFSGTIPNKAILKGLSGKFWHVEIEETENGVFFNCGWQRFVADHLLEFGDFLVFRYNGNSSFDVKIFGTNGCMKEEALAIKCTKKAIATVEKTAIPVKKNKCTKKATSTVEKTAIPVKIKRESEEKLTYPKSTHNCKRKYSEVGMESPDKSKVTGSHEVSRHKSRRTASKTTEQHRTFDALEFSMPKNPHFIASVRPAIPNRLNIPRQFLIENGIELKPEMVFHDQKGKLWPVQVSSTKDGRKFFTEGWMEFRKQNRVGLDDKCQFEFVFRRGRRLSREIQVQILRVGAQKLPRYSTRSQLLL